MKNEIKHTLLILLMFAANAGGQILINEIDSDTPGSDHKEFVELYDGGAGNTSLDGLVVVFFNGNGDVSYKSYDLDGYTTDENGYFVLGNDSVENVHLVFGNNSLQNGPDAVALYQGNAADFPGGTPVTTVNLLDGVVYGTNDAGDDGLMILLNAGQPQVNEGGRGDEENHSSQRMPNGSGGARNTATFDQLSPTPGADNESEVFELEIFHIQGSGMQSPFKDQVVITRDNVVTALDSGGFYIQTPSERTDDDPETSDGLFVYTGSFPPVSVGDWVDVTGRVMEYYDFTEIGDFSVITVTSSGHELPNPVILNETNPSPEQPQAVNELERFEGMLIKILNGMVTGPTDQYGDIRIVSASSRAFREPGIIYPGEPDLPVWDGNPEIFGIDPDGLMLPDVVLAAGTTIQSATGPLRYSYGIYEMGPVQFDYSETELPRAIRDREAGEWTIATQNLERLFDDVDDPDLIDEPVLDPVVFSERLEKISLYIGEVLKGPDVLAVQEVENLHTLEALSEKITEKYPEFIYSHYLEEGNDQGGIDVGFLVRNTVQVDSVIQVGKSAKFECSDIVYTLHDRPPLVLVGKLGDIPVTVIAVHNRSLSGIEGSDAHRIRQKRHKQALWISREIQKMQEKDPDIRLVIAGDFNAFQFTDGYVDVLGQITGNPDPLGAMIPVVDEVNPDMTNLMLSLPEADRYSYVYQGNAQCLDHILTSQGMDSMISDIAFTRGNADAPVSYENLSSPLRISDHDGLVIFLRDVTITDTTFLYQNFPNPFHESTSVSYYIEQQGIVRIEIYDILGRRVKKVLHQSYPVGQYSILWDGTDDFGKKVSSGIYVVKMTAGCRTKSIKTVCIR